MPKSLTLDLTATFIFKKNEIEQIIQEMFSIKLIKPVLAYF